MVKGGPERRPPHRDESRAAGQVWELRRRPCKGHSRPSKGCLCGKDGGRGGMWWAEDQLQRARPGESGKPSRTALNRGRLQDGLGKAGGRSPRSFSYTDSYNADIRFDNIYISTYFCQIDERRKKLGKRTLLPLRKAEKKTIIFPYDPAIQALEMKNLVPELLETLPVLLLLAVLCGLDWALYSAFDTIRHHSFLQYSFRSSHKLEVKVGGDSMLARLLRKTIGALNTSSESVVESSNIPCLPQPVALDAGAYVRTALPVGLLVCLCLLQAFGYRLRRVIAAFYFPKREKKRILFLYNELLRKRAAFTQLRRAAIVRQAQQQRAPRHRLADILHRSCPLLRPWLRRRCVVCQAPETPESYVCQTPECKAVYCRPCWDDMRRRCPACTPREELSSSAFSDSDDDVTYAE